MTPLVFNNSSCQGGQIIRSLSYQSSFNMPYLIENVRIEILMMISYSVRRRSQVEVAQLFREQQGTISKIGTQAELGLCR
jgi:hypothetical protein